MSPSPPLTVFRADEVLYHLAHAMSEDWWVSVTGWDGQEVRTRFETFDKFGQLVLYADPLVRDLLPVGTLLGVQARGCRETLEFMIQVAGWDNRNRMVVRMPRMVYLGDGRRRGAVLVGEIGVAVLDVGGKDGFVRLAVLEVTQAGLSFRRPQGVFPVAVGCRISGVLRLRGCGHSRLHIEVRHSRPFPGGDGEEIVGARFRDLGREQRNWLFGLQTAQGAQ
jgi:hypothetical protein